MSELPKFDSPPVVETVIGLSFDPIPGWGIQHLGLFWKEVRQHFPNCEVKPTLSDMPDDQSPSKGPEATIQVLDRPTARCWFFSAEGNALIQVQNNRFCYNWRKTSENQSYPHYDASIRRAFIDEWRRFSKFVEEELENPDIAIRQCEISYVNHIEIDSRRRMSDIFTDWSGLTTKRFLPEPEKVALSVSYQIPDNKGRLHVTAGRAVTNEGKEIIRLDLTCRGRPSPGSFDDVMSWMDQGREYIVRGFVDLTTDQMHKVWKLRGSL